MRNFVDSELDLDYELLDKFRIRTGFGLSLSKDLRNSCH